MDTEIQRLWNEGWTTGGIARHVGLPTGNIRSRIQKYRRDGVVLRTGVGPNQEALNQQGMNDGD
jgi:DNA-binding Lrp family transcriptional regulator